MAGSDVTYFDYNVNVMTSYEQRDHIEQTYGDKIVRIDEVRDSRGYLKKFKVQLTPGTLAEEQEAEFTEYMSDLEYDEKQDMKKEPRCLTCGDNDALCTCFDGVTWDWD